MDEIIENSSLNKEQVNPERTAESGVIRQNVEQALQKLSKREKSVFVLRNFKELPFDEIVKILNLRPGTVRSLNFRAIKKLRKELSFYQQDLQAEAIHD